MSRSLNTNQKITLLTDHGVGILDYMSRTEATSFQFVWRDRAIRSDFRAGVSLHSHTMYSEESLDTIAHYTARVPYLNRAIGFEGAEFQRGREKPDFVQIDYSIDDRAAEQRILPLAADVKAGVLTALPFGRGRLFRAVRGRAMPDWAQSFAESWAQFFLKYLLSDPRVTAVIPGTADPSHMIDNLDAMRGPLPDPDQRRQMVQFIDAL